MKTYQSHKTVEAAKIVDADMLHDSGGALLALDGGEVARVDRGWLAKHGEQGLVGGYLVRYPEDGYTSWSPAGAFENGYIEVVHDPKNGALPVSSYKPQTQTNVDCVNAMKTREELILRQLDHMKADAEVDQRWLAIGRTDIERGFMAINRSIFRPGRVAFPEDAQPDTSTENAP